MTAEQIEEEGDSGLVERVAAALGITLSQLDELEWSAEENDGNDGSPYGYIITFGEGSNPEILALVSGPGGGHTGQKGSV